jgi:DNA-binding NtrC family response regulator
MEHILIVEDDSSLRKALTIGLTTKKYKADSAGDGRTGVEKGSQKKYDILITDLCLPYDSGIEVIRKIKKYIPDIIPIIITGKGSMESRIQAKHLGVKGYLEKPVSLEAVKNAIVQGLKKRSLSKQEKM